LVIAWDYILDLLKSQVPHGSRIQLVYGIYSPDGQALFGPHQTSKSDVFATTHPRYSQVTFRETHSASFEAIT
jgi:hypothetical protein